MILGTRFEEQREIEERKRKDLEEGHLYTTIKIATEEIIKAHHAFDLCSFENHNAPNCAIPLKIKKEMLVGELMVTLNNTRINLLSMCLNQ